jgi:peptide/nickel transport system substrate-binding protein
LKKENLLTQLFPRIFPFLVFFFSILCSIPSSANSKHGGQLVLSTTSDPKSFNEIIAKETSTTDVLSFIFEGLTTVNVFTLQSEPLLAQSWEIKEDGLQWIFHLRRDVRWHDGVALTADDVVFTFQDLIFNPDIPSSARDIFTIDGQPFAVEKIDDFTVKFTLPVKFAPFLHSMTQAILPKHLLEDAVKNKRFSSTWGIDTDPKKIVGTGPYQLIRYIPGERLIYRRNQDYWRKSSEGDQLPYIEEIVTLIVRNVNVELLKFLEGSLDFYDLRGSDFPYLKPLEREKDFIVYDLGPDMGSSFLAFNMNPRRNEKDDSPFMDPKKLAWFSDIHFRQAIAHSIDKKRILEVVKYGLGYFQDSAMGPGAAFFHNPEVRKYDYDLNKANQILEQAGYVDRNGDGVREDKSGNDVEFTIYTNADNNERMDIGAIIRADLERVGLKVQLRGVEFNTLVSKINSTFDWDTIVLGLTGGVEPHFGKNVWTSQGQLHFWNPGQETPATDWEKRLDDLFTSGVQELDENKRKVIYDEFQMIISEEIPVVYTVLGARLRAARNKFGNLRPSNYGGLLHNLEEIYIKEDFRR